MSVQAKHSVVQYVSGDLFANRYGAEALAHGVNILGVMGSGIALAFKERFPEMYAEYRQYCQNHNARPGGVLGWSPPGLRLPYIFNLFTQRVLGQARPFYVARSLVRMRELAIYLGINSIAMPRIGAGIGHLDWSITRGIIEDVFREGTWDTTAEWHGTLYVYEKYEAESEK